MTLGRSPEHGAGRSSAARVRAAACSTSNAAASTRKCAAGVCTWTCHFSGWLRTCHSPSIALLDANATRSRHVRSMASHFHCA